MGWAAARQGEWGQWAEESSMVYLDETMRPCLIKTTPSGGWRQRDLAHDPELYHRVRHDVSPDLPVGRPVLVELRSGARKGLSREGTSKLPVSSATRRPGGAAHTADADRRPFGNFGF